MNEANIKVLLVEDDPLLQFVFKRQMQKLGFTLHIVGDGAAAVEKASTEDFHVIFMDVNMPVMNGLDATFQIRKDEQTKTSRVPIVGLTAYGERQMCLNAGMDDFLQKPVLMEELSEVINKWSTSRSEALNKSQDLEDVRNRINRLRNKHGLDDDE